MDIAVFDAQWIDVLTGWLMRIEEGQGINRAFSDASRHLPDPYHTVWLKLHADLSHGAYNSVIEGLHHMTETISSGALKLVADTLYQKWIGERSTAFDEDVENVLKVLWQNYGPQPLPSLMDFYKIRDKVYNIDIYDPDYTSDITNQLLELGDHLIPWLIGRVDADTINTYVAPQPTFDLLSLLKTPEAIRQLRRYLMSKNENYRKAARQALREMGAHANAPQYMDFEGVGQSIDLYLKVNLEPEDTLKMMLDIDKGFQYDQPEPIMSALASKVDKKTADFILENYEFTPTVELHFAIPRLSEEEDMTASTEMRLAMVEKGKEIIKKVLRITFDRLRNTDWDLILTNSRWGVLLIRRSGELLLCGHIWLPENTEEVTLPYTKVGMLPFPDALYPDT